MTLRSDWKCSNLMWLSAFVANFRPALQRPGNEMPVNQPCNGYCKPGHVVMSSRPVATLLKRRREFIDCWSILHPQPLSLFLFLPIFCLFSCTICLNHHKHPLNAGLQGVTKPPSQRLLAAQIMKSLADVMPRSEERMPSMKSNIPWINLVSYCAGTTLTWI
jgi:hypothetical protein